MHIKQLDDIADWFDSFAASFHSEDLDAKRNYDLKILHTEKVRANIELLADSLNLSTSQRALASVIAICHDVGRFPQYKKYATFNDATSVNHAALSVQTLINEGILDALDDVSTGIIIKAISLHNAFLLPDDNNQESRLFTRLIRDADKLDIWRVLIEYCTLPEQNRASAVVWELPDTGYCSEQALNEVVNGRMINRNILATADDFKLLQISWAYDLNFQESYFQLKANKYIETLSGFLPDQQGCSEAVAAVKEFIDFRLSQRQ